MFRAKVRTSARMNRLNDEREEEEEEGEGEEEERVEGKATGLWYTSRSTAFLSSPTPYTSCNVPFGKPVTQGHDAAQLVAALSVPAPPGASA